MINYAHFKYTYPSRAPSHIFGYLFCTRIIFFSKFESSKDYDTKSIQKERKKTMLENSYTYKDAYLCYLSTEYDICEICWFMGVSLFILIFYCKIKTFISLNYYS